MRIRIQSLGTDEICDYPETRYREVMRMVIRKVPAKAEILYPELSHTIMGIAYGIHNELGPGFGEDIYENAFIRELELHKIPYEAQKVITVAYKGEPIGVYRLDLLVDGKVIIELKAVTQMNDLFKQQTLSYLKAAQLRLGILINFGSSKVEAFRIVNSKAPKPG